MTPGAPISHTSVMATGLAVGGDVEQALENINVPSYVLDEAGVVRWMNAAAEQLLGNVRGRHFTSVLAPEDRPRARAVRSKEARYLRGHRGVRPPRLNRRDAGARGGQLGDAKER